MPKIWRKVRRHTRRQAGIVPPCHYVPWYVVIILVVGEDLQWNQHHCRQVLCSRQLRAGRCSRCRRACGQGIPALHKVFGWCGDFRVGVIERTPSLSASSTASSKYINIINAYNTWYELLYRVRALLVVADHRVLLILLLSVVVVVAHIFSSPTWLSWFREFVPAALRTQYE